MGGKRSRHAAESNRHSGMSRRSIEAGRMRLREERSLVPLSCSFVCRRLLSALCSRQDLSASLLNDAEDQVKNGRCNFCFLQFGIEFRSPIESSFSCINQALFDCFPGDGRIRHQAMPMAKMHVSRRILAADLHGHFTCEVRIYGSAQRIINWSTT